jgi:hypothetical protein
MSLQEFLHTVKPNQTIYLVVPGALIRGAFVRVDAGGELVTLSQTALFQNSQATASIPGLTVSTASVIAWG